MEMKLDRNTLSSRSSSAFYKTVIFLFALAFCLMIASCNGCSNSNSNHFQDSRAESPINPLVEEVDKKALEDAKKDTALFRDMCRRLEGTWYYDLQEWKILKGKIYFYYLEEQQLAHERRQFLVDEAQITNLTPDNLTFVFRGRTYDCQRPPKKPLMTN